MTIEEFNNTRFGNGDQAVYNKDGIRYQIKSLDFDEKLVGIITDSDNLVDGELTWVRCENINYIPSIKVRIIEKGKARELNPLGEKPNINESYDDCTKEFCAIISCGAMCHGVCWRKEVAEEQWTLEESKLITFEIENSFTCQREVEMLGSCTSQCEHCAIYYKELDSEKNEFILDSIHKAEILINGKIRIIDNF